MTFELLEASGLSLLAAASWGGGDFAGGLASKRASVFRVVAVAHACGLVATLAMALLLGEAIPPASALAWGAFAGFVGAFGVAALYRALAIGRMGVVAPVAAVVTGVLPVLVGIRSEGLPDKLQLGGFALALISIWLVARTNEHIDSHRGIGLAALAGIIVRAVSDCRKTGWARRSVLASGGRPRRLDRVDASADCSDAARFKAAAPGYLAGNPLGLAGLRRQCSVYRRHPPRTARCGGGAVVALSRQYRHPGAFSAQGAHRTITGGGHRLRCRIRSAGLVALGKGGSHSPPWRPAGAFTGVAVPRQL